MVRSLPSNPKVPSSIPGFHSGFCREWNVWRLSFLLKFTQLSIFPRSVRLVPACMDCLEAATICACICFQSAGVKLIAFETFVIKALYKCTTLLLKISLVTLEGEGSNCFRKGNNKIGKCKLKK